MFNRTISSGLAAALQALKIGSNTLRNKNKEVVEEVSAIDHAKALFTYLNLGGYLDAKLIETAVTYLAAVAPFAVKPEKVSADLTKVCRLANNNGKFDADFFVNHFATEDYFTITDIVELIVFLQQTAFDRLYGVERNRLLGQPWQETDEYKDVIKKLGVTSPRPPLHQKYSATFIMGAAATRVEARMDYASLLTAEFGVDSGPLYALSGERKLSKGLDDVVFADLEKALGKPLEFIDGPNDTKLVKDITETMMVNYYIEKKFQTIKIGVVDSKIEEDHWRATTAKSAKDIAPIIIKQIADQKLEPSSDDVYRILVIAEQPFSQRMTMQLQREFYRLKPSFTIALEGAGNAADLTNKNVLAVINSDLGALMAERYNDALFQLANTPGYKLRDQNILMFSTRQKTYEKALAKKLEAKQEVTAGLSP